MADRLARGQHEAAARGAGKKPTTTTRRKTAAAGKTKTATQSKPGVAEGVLGKGRKAKKGSRAEALVLLKKIDSRKLKLVSDGQWVKVVGQCPTDLLMEMSRCSDALGQLVREREEAAKKKVLVKDGGVKKKPREEAGRIARATSKEWEESDPLPDAQHEMFAKAIAYGAYSQTACYLMAYEEVERSTARTNASRLLTNANVSARVDWLKREAVKLFQVNKVEIMRDLYVGWKTPVGHIDLESPLAQEVSYDAETGAITKVKMPGKTDMLKILLQMEGIEKPANDPLEKAVDAMADMIRMIREKRGTETA